MPNDAKLGFALGVALVIAVAVVFYRTEPTAVSTDPAAIIAKPDPTEPPVSPSHPPRRTPAATTSWTGSDTPAQFASDRRVTAEDAKENRRP